ncbi:MFS transporter [Streptomyces iconiensis]|uniref:MFS transporter n=1 Tax=Streptomyces iconiensis TaxID=1384038 RepID=A0ABT7A203_9ACTN|nr:MFS transporter [Streptomyces iconiensis]MDJ1134876.1 MFS transporter [Streptomyces iconiensis]
MTHSPPASPVAKPPARTLRSRNFLLFFAARAVAKLGDAMLPLALSAGLIQEGHGPGAIGAALASLTICLAGFVIFGGVFCDRLNTRALMIGADLVRLCTQALLAGLFLTGHIVLWQICAIGAVNGIAAGLFQPGVASTIPRVADDVQGANGLIRTAESLAMLLGPALAGMLVAGFSPGGVFAAHAATYALSALCLALLRLPAATVARAAARVSSYRADLVEGWREFRSRTWMWGVIVIWMVYMITVAGPLVPLTASEIIPSRGAGAFGLVNSALGAGTALGGLCALRFRPVRQLRAGSLALLGYCCFPLAVGAAMPTAAMMAGAAVSGAGLGFWGVMWSTSVQTQVPGPVLNRIHAYEVAGSLAMMPVGQALAGPAALLFGGRTVLLAGGVMAVVVCGALLAVPAIRNLRAVNGGPSAGSGTGAGAGTGPGAGAGGGASAPKGQKKHVRDVSP